MNRAKLAMGSLATERNVMEQGLNVIKSAKVSIDIDSFSYRMPRSQSEEQAHILYTYMYFLIDRPTYGGR